jgi:hypothetical protein
MSMLKKEHERLMIQNNIKQGSTDHKTLSLKLDHFYHSQPKKLVQEQLKYIATALRAEKTLREHMFHMTQHQQEMNQTMALAAQFSHCYQEGLTKRDQEMMQEDFLKQQEEAQQENKKENKVSKVSDTMKFGRNKANIAKLFQK